MALQAVLPQLAFVRVLVAGGAALRNPQECVAQIFHLDQRSCGRIDVRGIVALGACEAAVLSLERVACLIVIETLQRWDPVDQLKVLSVVFGVARRAVLAIGKFCVQAAMLDQLLRDLCVTLLAFENGGSLSCFVATGALRGAI